MIVSKRAPRVDSEPTDWVRLYDRHFQSFLAEGADSLTAERKAFAACSVQWIRANPMHGDYLAMGNRGVCCFCGHKGADAALAILGDGVYAHSGPGRPGKFEMAAKKEAGCWDAVVYQLSAIARAGLEAEGLVLDHEPVIHSEAA